MLRRRGRRFQFRAIEVGASTNPVHGLQCAASLGGTPDRTLSLSTMTLDSQPPDTRAGRCAIVGRPNVGKSTLLNAILGQKLVIATERPGTTRSNVLGVHMADDLQIAFVDTPGIGAGKTALHRALSAEAKDALNGLDAACLVIEAHPRNIANPGDETIRRALADTGAPVVVAVNKVDRLKDKSRLLPIVDHWSKHNNVVATVPISAEAGTNLPELVGEIGQRMPPGLLYSDDVLTDRPTRFFAAELIREAALRHVRAEVPHGIAVHLDRYAEEATVVHIEATVFVEKESHKPIVIGRQGSLLKQIGTEARLAIEELIERRVMLKLWVKVSEGWTQDPRRVRSMTEETEG